MNQNDMLNFCSSLTKFRFHCGTRSIMSNGAKVFFPYILSILRKKCISQPHSSLSQCSFQSTCHCCLLYRRMDFHMLLHTARIIALIVAQIAFISFYFQMYCVTMFCERNHCTECLATCITFERIFTSV